MIDAENLDKLLGHLPPAVFRDFMEEQFKLALPKPDATQGKKEQRAKMAETIASLAASERQAVEEVAEKLVLLTDGAGQDVVEGLSELIFDEENSEAFEAFQNQYERSLWLFRKHPEVFWEAINARQADVFRQSATCYSGFIAPKNLAVIETDSARDDFHQKASALLGCPKENVAIKLFKRLRPDSESGEEVVLYQVSVHYNRPPELVDRVDQSELTSDVVIRSDSSHVTYEPANGHLEVLCRDPDGREALARLAADTWLQSPLTGEKIPLKQYDYQSLASPRTFDLSSENVSSVKVTELGYSINNRTLCVKILAKDPVDIYAAAKSLIAPTFDFRHHEITYAKLSIRIKKLGKERARTVTVVLRDANKCNVKTKREKDRALCDRLLAAWGLVKEIGDGELIHAAAA